MKFTQINSMVDLSMASPVNVITRGFLWDSRADRGDNCGQVHEDIIGTVGISGQMACENRKSTV